MAYALQILIEILEQDQYHLTLAIKPQIESFLQKSRRLRDLLVAQGVAYNLERRIIDVSHKAEDLIESHIRNQVVVVPSADRKLDLTDITNELDSIENEISTMKSSSDPEPSFAISSSSDPNPGSENIVVGLDEDLLTFLDKLTKYRYQTKLSIVGMAGIGKTTLAQQLYNHPLIVNHYDMRLWVSVSQSFDLRGILIAILSCLESLSLKMRDESDAELGVLVHQHLCSGRYFIVLDNMRDTSLEVWKQLGRFLPSEDNGNRILITTRDQNVVRATSSEHHQMHPMNEDKSWELLCLKVFGKVSCPPEVENIGKMIAKRCQGLPLAITSLARLLSNSEKKLEHWARVAMNVISFDMLVGSDMHILSEWYNHLPCHLKPCFLYLGGIYPEDYEIRASRIIKLWIAEGFIKSSAHEILENTAHEYFNLLIDLNLLLVCRDNPNKKAKTFKIHFLLRELCHKISIEDKFLWINNLEDHAFPEDVDLLRRVSVQQLGQPGKEITMPQVVRSFLCLSHASQRLAPLFLGLTLLRVLDVFEIEFFHFPKEILQCINLRYLAFSCHSDLPSSISTLKNLQYLISCRLPSFRTFSLPSQLWELTQLRNITCKESCIWYYHKYGKLTVQKKLQSLSVVQISEVTNELFRYTPNLRKLGLFCNKLVNTDIHLDVLDKLEELKCSSNLSWATHDFLSYLVFPRSLRMLTLRSCKIPWGFMGKVGALPGLAQLKLQKCDFQGEKIMSEPDDLEGDAKSATWELVEGEFTELLFLQMEDLNLVHWGADDLCLPRLNHLIVRGCSSMKEIPLDIGYLPELERIELDEYCSPSVISSSMKIRNEYGTFIQVHIVSGTQEYIDRSREKNEFMSLKELDVEQNLHISPSRMSYLKKPKEWKK